MGEMCYRANNKYIMFGYDSDYGCLCTFPHNNEVIDKVLGKGTIANLALLGAAVAIAANKPESMNKESMTQSWGTDVYVLPNCVPEWIRNAIDKELNIQYKTNEEDLELENEIIIDYPQDDSDLQKAINTLENMKKKDKNEIEVKYEKFLDQNVIKSINKSNKKHPEMMEKLSNTVKDND
jgi:hypothetical protein